MGKVCPAHPGNQVLNVNPLYSLHEELLGIISGKATGALTEQMGVVPGFLSKEEVAFERDLARTVSGGFFHQQPFDCVLLAKPVDKRLDDLGEKIRSALVETLAEDGVHPQRTHSALDAEARYQEMADHRAVAYAAWLVMSPRFREERDALRETWGKFVDDKKRFPWLGGPPLGAPVRITARNREAQARFMFFYRRWGLQTFLTWDLPVPLRPAIQSSADLGEFGATEAGVSLFVPWYVLRDGRFKLADLAHQMQTLANPDHLAGWIEAASTPKSKRADVRLRHCAGPLPVPAPCSAKPLRGSTWLGHRKAGQGLRAVSRALGRERPANPTPPPAKPSSQEAVLT